MQNGHCKHFHVEKLSYSISFACLDVGVVHSLLSLLDSLLSLSCMIDHLHLINFNTITSTRLRTTSGFDLAVGFTIQSMRSVAAGAGAGAGICSAALDVPF